MKKLFFILLLLSFNIHSFAKKKLEVVIICLGEKTPNSFESSFPEFKFFYTPKLTVENLLMQDYDNSNNYIAANRLIVKGTPKFLEEWSRKQNLNLHTILFDKNGTGVWEGYLDNSENLLNIKGFNEKTIGFALAKYVENNNSLKRSNDNPVFYSENSIYRGKYYQHPFIEKEMINFAVYNHVGKKFFVKSFFANKKPVLILFYISNKKSSKEYNNNIKLLNNLKIALK